MWRSSTYERLQQFVDRVKKSFDAVKREMDDHLESINKNTDEIHDLYDYLSELDSKIDKVNERMDRFEMMIDPDAEAFHVTGELSRREQEVFMALYTADSPVSVEDVARRTALNEAIVRSHLYDLIDKGVPLEKDCDKDCLRFHLNSRFKDVQAKKNVLNIKESVAKDMRA